MSKDPSDIQFSIDRIGLPLNPSGWFKPAEEITIRAKLQQEGYDPYDIELAFRHYNR